MNPVETQTTNWIGIASIWIGGMVSIPSLLIGSTLIGGMNFNQALLSGLLGIGFVVVFMCLESVASVEFRLNTIELAKSAFGRIGGAILVGAIVGLATMGWFGVQTNIAGVSFSKILADTLAIELPAYFSSIFWGLIMLLTAVYGFRLMKWLNYLAVPAIILLMVYGLGVSFSEKGWGAIASFEPSGSMSFLSAIGLAIGFVSVGGVISPDINRFSATKKDAIWGSILGLLPAGLLLLSIGAILGILQGTHDITEIFSELGYPVLALSILILATWTTNVVNAYSGGLALNQLLGLPEEKRPRSTLIAGILGTGLAVGGILNNFIGFLTLLTTTIPPIAGVLIADYWLAKSFQAESTQKINWRGFLGWFCGVATMVFLEDPVKNLLAIAVSAVVFWGANKVIPR
ncbi:MAG: cytosine permease [Bacteroidota bacterium]